MAFSFIHEVHKEKLGLLFACLTWPILVLIGIVGGLWELGKK
jgi:hypothetical protein